mmetsp:Transcript_4068/g.6002  ORF Transcript_4068/g.6002 Transcript_4068/m.6002 type:complete len:92 (+) Transcript_4068:124-399(+)|eukprot:CAMPEP_0194076978 /NCGR_PEP_ID=MMETSP0149-20130528/3688_1 /TAXON_ID=122233 /ORGANISM="Chaetoceros debilis, Strain MM31A-1" /LENGTH=91 /DNA_ID=CAMNT_0038757867 /DNA_START=45 /DNA_END=320 /DNA_ORIENTATION=-
MNGRGGSPRRNAIEYGILLTTATVMCAGMGIMIVLKDKNRLGTIDLNGPVDFKTGMAELSKEISGMRDSFIGAGRGSSSAPGTNGQSNEKK